MVKQGSMMEARLGVPPSSANLDYIVKAELDGELVTFDEAVLADLAHVVMLTEVGILSQVDGAAILGVLRELRRQGRAGLPIDPLRGSLLLQVEHLLGTQTDEDVAGRMHTGRSRNDLGGAISRLYARNRLIDVITALNDVQNVVLTLAPQHLESYMPGYTHLQHAQPTTLAHFLLRYYFLFERDLQRLEGAFSRTNLSALGGAALTGTSWPLDRERVATLLGHEGLVEVSLDTGVFPRDYPLENLCALSMVMNNAGQLAGDLYLWATWEFGFIEVADELAGTSSIMPQKKNPHVFERIRGLSGRAIGWVPATMGVLRSSSSSDLDLFWSGELMPSASSDTYQALKLVESGLATSTFNTEVMRERAGANWGTATYLTDEIVRATGLSFRTVHSIVGRFVRRMIERGLTPESAEPELLSQAAEEITGSPLAISEDLIRRSMKVENAVLGLVTAGSASPESCKKLITAARELHDKHGDWVARKATMIADSVTALETAVDEIVAHG